MSSDDRDVNAEPTSTSPPSDVRGQADEPRGTFGLLGWGVDRLGAHRELVGIAFVAGLFSVVSQLFTTTVQTQFGPAEQMTAPGYLFSLLGLVAFLVAWAVVFLTAEDETTGTIRELGERVSAGLGRTLSLFGVGVLTVILSTIGLLLLVLPGIYLFLRLSFAYPAAVIDGEDPFSALGTSWRIAKGNMLTILGLWLAYFVATFATTAIVAVAFGASFFTVGVLGSLVQAAVAALLVPVFGLAAGRFYLSARAAADERAATID